jgi:hypothetical protein
MLLRWVPLRLKNQSGGYGDATRSPSAQTCAQADSASRQLKCVHTPACADSRRRRGRTRIWDRVHLCPIHDAPPARHSKRERSEMHGNSDHLCPRRPESAYIYHKQKQLVPTINCFSLQQTLDQHFAPYTFSNCGYFGPGSVVLVLSFPAEDVHEASEQEVEPSKHYRAYPPPHGRSLYLFCAVDSSRGCGTAWTRRKCSLSAFRWGRK